jgi:hypothetical protein
MRYCPAREDLRDVLELVTVAFGTLAGASEQQLDLGIHLCHPRELEPSDTDRNRRHLHTDTYQVRMHHLTRFR